MIDQDPTIAGCRILERPTARGTSNIYRAPRKADGPTVVLRITNAEYPRAKELTRFGHDRARRTTYDLLQEAEKPALNRWVGNLDLEAAVETLEDIEARLP